MNLPSAEFYQVLLSKINTFQYAGDALFKVKKGRKKRRVLEDRPQLLKAFSEYEWNSGRSGLSEDEKLHFHIYECPGSDGKAPEYKYRFNDPGRFKLIIVPNIISEVKLLDEQLEQDIDLLKNLITARNLDARINKLTGGGYHYWKWADFDKPRYLESERQALLEMSTALEIKRDQYFKRNEHFKNKRTK